MSVRKAHGRLLSSDGIPIGEGRVYVHLRAPETDRQAAEGTLSLDWWDSDWSGANARLDLADGPTLVLELESDKISACVRGRILRYTTVWPGA